jgi:integrase
MSGTKRRGAGEGSVYKGPDGRWRGAVDLGWDNGKRVRKYLSGRTQNEVLAKVRAARQDVEHGVESDANMTVEKWLRHWLATVVDGRVGSDNTRANYEQVVRVHLVPQLGKVRLDKLTPERVDRLLAAKASEGKAKSTVNRIRSVLADALNFAQGRGLVARNVAALSVMPKLDPPAPRRSMTPDEARALMVAAKDERLEALVLVGLVVGLRPGELTGLLWSDLELDATPPTLTVSGAMKREVVRQGKRYEGYELNRGAVKRSTAGQRTAALPPIAVDALRAHRARQAAERLAAGELWEDQGLVFSSEVGTPLDPSNVRRTFRRVATRAGLDARFPYLLRHTAVSLLIDAGAGIEEVADLLGDDPRTLYRHYRHKVRPVAEAATRMQDVLAPAKR